MRKRIEVVSYDTEWPEMFMRVSACLKAIPGCIAVHHVGSTAVPGLMAKPIIDIIVVLENARAGIPDIENLGYTYRGEMNIPFRHYFRKLDEECAVNLHLYEDGNPEIQLNLCFRDYLRTHPEAMKAYAELKQQLVREEYAHVKTEVGFTGYNLGKDQFIREVLQQVGFEGMRLMMCTHYAEWDAYHRIREAQIFRRTQMVYDRNHPTLTDEGHFHFVLCKGTQVVSVAHVEFLSEKEAALRSLATDEEYKCQGYASYMLGLLERWVKEQGRKVIKVHAALDAEKFYRNYGYEDMLFADVSISTETIDLGKKL